MNRQGQRYYAIIMHSAWRRILNVPGVHVVNVSKRFEFINKPSFIYYLDCPLLETHGQIFNDDWLGFACGCKWMNKVPAFALKHFIKYIYDRKGVKVLIIINSPRELLMLEHAYLIAKKYNDELNATK